MIYEQRYFVISTSIGNILVLKFLESRRLESQKILIHSFLGHFAAVPSIVQMAGQQNLILSVSMDSTARIWSLDSFQMQYVFQLPNLLSLVSILDHGRKIICAHYDSAEVLNLNMILKNYSSVESDILKIIPGFHSKEDQDAGNVGFTISVCSDNSAFIRNIEGSATAPKTTLYPPPSAQLIVKVLHSLRINRFIVLLRNSTLCVYNRVKETCLLEKM